MKKNKKITFNLHFTDFCNYHCKHCFVKKESKELSLEQIKTIVDKIAEYQSKTKIKCRINLAGGEPLASKNIQSIIDYINSKKIMVSIITNGSLLTNDFIATNKNKISMIGLSIDSFDYGINRIIGRTCGETFLNFRKACQICKCIRDNKIKLKINCCISRLNIEEFIPEMIAALKPDRIKFLRVMSAHLSYTLARAIKISKLEWLGFCQKYKNLAKEVIFEDNDFMSTGYIIIDSSGNMSRDNLHLKSNSVLADTIANCLKKIDKRSYQSVYVKEGLYAGLNGLVMKKSKDKSNILLKFFGRESTFWIPNSYLKFQSVKK